jgi:hypothetical protein
VNGVRRRIRLLVMWGLVASQLVWPLSCWRELYASRSGQRVDPAASPFRGTLSRQMSVRVSGGGVLFCNETYDGGLAPVPVEWAWDIDRSAGYPRPARGYDGSVRWIDCCGLVAGHDWAVGASGRSACMSVVVPWWMFVAPSVVWAAWLWKREGDSRRVAMARLAFPLVARTLDRHPEA